MDKIDDEIYKERRRIAYRLCGYLIPLGEIAGATKLSIDEVYQIQEKRTEYYNRKAKEDAYFLLSGRFKHIELDDIESEEGGKEMRNKKGVAGFTEEEILERIEQYKGSTGFNSGKEYEEYLRKNEIINYPETMLRLWKDFDEWLKKDDENEV